MKNELPQKLVFGSKENTQYITNDTVVGNAARLSVLTMEIEQWMIDFSKMNRT